MFDKGYVSAAQKISEELALKKARFALEQAQSKRKVLVEYTKAKTIKELQSDVEEGAIRRIGQEGDLGAGDEQGEEARATDRGL